MIRSVGTRGKRLRPQDLTWAAQVKIRDGRCLRCGTTRDLDAAHIKSKQAHPEDRWTAGNGITLCREHHQWSHAHPGAFRAWVERVREKAGV